MAIRIGSCVVSCLFGVVMGLTLPFYFTSPFIDKICPTTIQSGGEPATTVLPKDLVVSTTQATPTIPPSVPVPTNANNWLREVLGNINAPKYAKLLPLLDTLKKDYDHDDPELINIVRRKYLIPPPNKNVPYRLGVDSNFDTSMGQSEKVMEILKNKTDGFFIECGALDGEKRSNTLIFERMFGWQGLLIEADPINLMNCYDTHRKTYLVPACLSTKKSSMHVQYRAWEHIGAIVDHKVIHRSFQKEMWMKKMVNVTCIPFNTIMTALRRSTVDYFSLDVEGNELDILKTIDFDKFDIKVISAEFSHEREGNLTKAAMTEFMEQNGYIVHSTVIHPHNLANDYIFVKSTEFDSMNA